MTCAGESTVYLVVAAGFRKSENLPLPEEFSRKTAAKVAAKRGS
jgi:hypothetical protein